MRLTALDPHWVGAGGPGISNADGSPSLERHGVGLSFKCPCGQHDSNGSSHRVYVPFHNPIDGKGPHASQNQPLWNRVGDTFETLTLTPSIQRLEGCRWHGFVTNGNVLTC